MKIQKAEVNGKVIEFTSEETEDSHMNKTTATARPWKVVDTKTSTQIWADGSPIVTHVVGYKNMDNASLIVKAVNNHEALLEACREALAHDREAMLPSTVEMMEKALNATQR
jgi:hypothetical protein